MKNKEITVLDQEIHINKDDYFSLTDIAKYKNPDNAFIVVANWMRNHSTISFLACGNKFTIPILNLSNSIGLKQNLVIMLLR